MVLLAPFLSSAYMNDECYGRRNIKYGVSWQEVNESTAALVSREKFRLTEDVIARSLVTTKNIFANPTTKTALTTLAIGSSKIPFLGEFFNIVSSVAGLLEAETDWKDTFTKVITEEMRKGHVMNDLDNFSDVVHSLKNRFSLLNESVSGKNELTWKTAPEVIGFATDIFSRLEEMTISFAKPDSQYKRHPLIGAMFFIELSLLGLAFEPIAIPLLREASRYKLSCELRDATLDFLPFVLSARFGETNLRSVVSKTVRGTKYNKNGYIPKEHETLPCGTQYGCELHSPACLYDSLGKSYYACGEEDDLCHYIYACYLRASVEARFPIDLLQQECDQPRGEKTGNSMDFNNS